MTTDDKMLEAAFAQARTPDIMPSEAALDRIMMDADSVLAEAAPVASRPKQGFGALILEAIGGWPSFSGLAAATVAGLWIGVSPPAALTDLSAGIWGATIEVPLLESDMFAGLEG
ncbi:MAG: hypothetical protein KIH44_007365 [Octadecabacter sp.]|nr:hypothetical protein [Octadecabacter sp.]